VNRASSGAAAVLAALLLPASAGATPKLRSADAQIEFLSPTACRVELTLGVDDAPEVIHRLEVVEGASIELIEVRGAAVTGPAKDVGRTRVLTTRSEAPVYTLRYAVQQPAGWRGRCPLWVPTIAADGRSAGVRLVVRIPPGAMAAGTMPTFKWAGEEGTAAIAHLPAFVRVPFAGPGEAAPWNIARGMDTFSIAVLVVATLAWVRRRRSSQPLVTRGPQDLQPGRHDA
jgi:hypothetical protein